MSPLRRPFGFAALGATLSLLSCGGTGGAGRARTAFDGRTALGYIRTQLDFGPRIPGTEGARRCGDWILAQMRTRADTVVVQTWTHRTADGTTLPLRNILARFRPTATDRVLYVTHWDTRPISDEATDTALRKLPVPGANDGASGTPKDLLPGALHKYRNMAEEGYCGGIERFKRGEKL